MIQTFNQIGHHMKKLFALLLLGLMSYGWARSAEKPKVKIACIGNSITYGAGIANRFQHSYPGILQQMLGEGYDVRNFGVSATTMLNKGNKPYMLENDYLDAKKFQPDIVTIKLGTNDSKPINWCYSKDFDDDMLQMVDELLALPSKPKIYLCYPAPAFQGNYTISDSIITHGVMPMIRKVAKKRKLEIIDLNTPLQAHNDLFRDNIHPSKYGARIIAENIYEALTGKTAPACDVDQPFPGKKTDWKGYDRYDFQVCGRAATVVVPHKEAAGRPWIWRPAFFGVFSWVDEVLLEKGFHVAYYDVTHLYGSPRAVALGTEFYNVMCSNYGCSDKVTLEGLSRGGYFALNWAAAHPDKVACVYIDAPVCDINSWPGRDRQTLWQDFLEEWHLADADVTSRFKGNAMQLLNKLKRGNVAILGVCGDSDTTVPLKDNFMPFRDAYQAIGGNVQLIIKKGVDHHPHSLEKPEPIVDFILCHQKGYDKQQHINYRTRVTNAFSKFEKEKKGCVAFFGGSITEMKGWRNQVQEDLKQRFPHTDFQFIEAGIGSLGSVPHSFRMAHDVLEQGTPDLMFIEAAVNDNTNMPGDAVKDVRGMEGVIRHARMVNPCMDIIMLHFMCDKFREPLDNAIVPDVIMNHERVANYYGVTSINLAQEISERLRAGEFDWKFFKGTHPSWGGHKYYTAAINQVFDWSQAPKKKLNRIKYTLPQEPLDKYSYFPGKFMDIGKAQQLRGFSVVDNWQPEMEARTRHGFVNVPMLVGLKSGAAFELKFSGKVIGIFGVCGPEAGTLYYTIDGKPYQPIDTYTRWSGGLYIPWATILADELSDGPHTLRLTVKGGKKAACHIRNFLVVDDDAMAGNTASSVTKNSDSLYYFEDYKK